MNELPPLPHSFKTHTDYAEWLAGMLHALGDYGKEAAQVLPMYASAIKALRQRIAELEAQLVAWNQKAATWIASPEAAKRLEGYKELTARIAELEAQIAHLTASLETASASCIMLKQQQRKGRSQLASGQSLVTVKVSEATTVPLAREGESA
jgi:uncharacterized coiled-coil protein SlyX